MKAMAPVCLDQGCQRTENSLGPWNNVCIDSIGCRVNLSATECPFYPGFTHVICNHPGHCHCRCHHDERQGMAS